MSVKKSLSFVRTWYNSDAVSPIEWALLVIISIFAFFSFRYSDLDSLTIWSLHLIDCIADGNLFGYYAYTVEAAGDELSLYGWRDVASSIPMAVWNIPIWAAQRFFGVNVYTATLPILWSKLFLVFSLCVSAFYAFKIALLMNLTKNKAVMAAFLTAASSYAFLGVYYAGQNCIVSIAFSTIAVYELMRGRKNRFLVFSMLAVMVKPFYVFALIAVILIAEKNVYQILRSAIICILPTVISGLVFSSAPMYAEIKEMDVLTDAILRGMFEMGLPTRFGNLSFNFTLILILYYLCFSKRFNNEKERNYFIIYAITAIYLVLTMFTHDGFYRLVLLAPFLYILVLLNPKSEKTGLLVTGAVSFAVMLFFTTQTNASNSPFSIYSTFAFDKTIWSPVPGSMTTFGYFGEFVFASIPYELFPLIPVVIIAGMFWTLAAYYPGSRLPVPFAGEKAGKLIVWLNAYQAAVFVFGSIFLFTQVRSL